MSRPFPIARAMRVLACTTLTLAGAAGAHALSIVRVTPQGEVAQVRQITVRFNEDAVRFGDPQAPAPVAVQCNDDRAAQGQGRWTGAREWVFDFAADLPPGTRCQTTPTPDFKSPAGTVMKSASSYAFNTGGPFVQHILPHPGSRIEEEQSFILRLNGDATPESVAANVWCAVDGLGERVPIRPLPADQRDALFKARGMDKAAASQPLRFAAFQCNRRLTPAARVQVVYGAGVSTPSGVANRIERRIAFTVREPFTAGMSCERESAQSGCLPMRPITLLFSAPVNASVAAGLRLQGEGVSHAPVIEADQPGDDVLHSVSFPAPLPENTGFSITLPPDFKDASGRPLTNAASFPLKVATGPMPPLAKFAAAPFGVIERFAEGKNGPALMPLTVRRVEAQLPAQGLNISHLQPQSDADIIAWFRRVQRYDSTWIDREVAQNDPAVRKPLPKAFDENTRHGVEARTLSLLAQQSGVQTLTVPPPPSDAKGQAAGRPFEVVGIPLAPGFHVLEVASQHLGQSLLNEQYGAPRTMYVRSSALVTNLGVHFKQGRDDALAWVTALDSGQPVADAAVQVSDCQGKVLANARTDARGIARFERLNPDVPQCDGELGYWSQRPYFVSARANVQGVQDMAFTWSTWQRGIEPWRFNVPTSSEAAPDEAAHTVFDRTLLRAGETVSMKHYLRTLTRGGFGLMDEAATPTTLTITHMGSGQEFTQPLKWRTTATGGRSAESTLALPPSARLGVYTVEMRAEIAPPGRDYPLRVQTGQFRVEEFRLPVLQGRVAPASADALVAVTRVPTQVQVDYVSGGPASALPVQVSALVRDKALGFADHDNFSFEPPRPAQTRSTDADTDGEEEPTARQDQRVVADKLPATLDAQGLGTVEITDIPASNRARELLIEASFADPNGEIQTLRGNATLWPAGVIAGIRAERWASVSSALKVQALALDVNGAPRAGVPLTVRAVARITTSSRKRMVGGFYTYDHRTEVKDLGTVCSGKSNARGLLDCEARLKEAGEVELVASADDGAGRSAQAATSVWVTRQGELWFDADNHDRMDVLPEKKRYEPGDTATLQVRMPFRQATALVAVEREGVLHTEVVQLRGDDPTVRLRIDPAWGPNVYVSVLALRGRLHEVPWYSFFTWGYKTPVTWWRAWRADTGDTPAPTPLVDLSKPAFRFGMAEIRVGTQAHTLAVSVKADKERYPVRGKAQVTVQVTGPDGQPAANAEVALAAVDEALLELLPNRSWQLLDAMLQRRAWGVQTATAQMEIVGRRHYGRKAVPAGGDGGGAPTRELLDTLLLWQPVVQLDAQGRAQIEVPLNDALTTFRVVAVADAGTGLFGTGSARIRSAQDLQIISGLPPLVRGGDTFTAMLTLRNTTQQPMQVEVKPRATLIELAAQTVELPAGQARQLEWQVTTPPALAATRAGEMLWEIEAVDRTSGARDALKLSQRVQPAVPVTVRQAMLVQLDGLFTQNVAPPATALPGSGGVQIALQPRLADGLPGVRDWFDRYPYTCLEQQTSKAIGLRDASLWAEVARSLPTYLDADGLVHYFPPRAGHERRGSDSLTAWLLAATHEAEQLNPAFVLPPEVRTSMLMGLTAFVEGRIQRRFWSPRADLDVRKIAALEALSRHGAARPAMLGSITIAPNQWPTSAVIDWINVLKRVQGIPNQPKLLQEADQILRARLSTQGTRLIFSTEQSDYWWWLMAGGDVNTARLLLTVMDDPAWKDDMGRLVSGFIGRQDNGAWHTTTANLWGGMALERFSKTHEADPVAGTTRATLGSEKAQIDWTQVTRLAADGPQGRPHARSHFGAPASPSQYVNNTALLPWPQATPAAGTPLIVAHEGSGKPWLTLQSLAAVPLTQPVASGYAIQRSVTPVEQADKSLPAGHYSRGDILRVRLQVTASADMTWVAITDPVPGGATILGSGLGRDSQIATAGEQFNQGRGWLAYEERAFEAFRSYYEYLPKGTITMEYTVRLNNPGTFSLPPSRVEALYAPEMFGEAPNGQVTVK
ncbi:MAG: MG2 domain-containing protein [Pseudomonadota bacterium]|nr:MG2 domain-containing protein [Pseudomonadota bacterium]